jgi:hypothetical protein
VRVGQAERFRALRDRNRLRNERRRNYQRGRGHIFGADNSENSLSSGDDLEEVLDSEGFFNRKYTTLNYSEADCLEKKIARSERLKARQALLESDRANPLPTKYKPSPVKKPKKPFERLCKRSPPSMLAIPHNNENVFSLFSSQDVEMHRQLYGLQNHQKLESKVVKSNHENKPTTLAEEIPVNFDPTSLDDAAQSNENPVSQSQSVRVQAAQKQKTSKSPSPDKEDYIPESEPSSQEEECSEENEWKDKYRSRKSKDFKLVPPPAEYVPFSGILQVATPGSTNSPVKLARGAKLNEILSLAGKNKRFKAKAIFKPDWSVSQKSEKPPSKHGPISMSSSAASNRMLTRSKKVMMQPIQKALIKPINKQVVQPSKSVSLLRSQKVLNSAASPAVIPQMTRKLKKHNVQSRSQSQTCNESVSRVTTRSVSVAKQEIPEKKVRNLPTRALPSAEIPARKPKRLSLNRMMKGLLRRNDIASEIRSPTRTATCRDMNRNKDAKISSPRVQIHQIQRKLRKQNKQVKQPPVSVPMKVKARKQDIVKRVAEMRVKIPVTAAYPIRVNTRSKGPVDSKFRHTSIAKLNLIIQSMAGKRAKSTSVATRADKRTNSAKQNAVVKLVERIRTREKAPGKVAAKSASRTKQEKPIDTRGKETKSQALGRKVKGSPARAQTPKKPSSNTRPTPSQPKRVLSPSSGRKGFKERRLSIESRLRSRSATPIKTHSNMHTICNFFEAPEEEKQAILSRNPRRPEEEIDAIVGHYLQQDSEDELKYRRQLEKQDKEKQKKKKALARKDQVITRSTRVYPGRNGRSREHDKKPPTKKIAFEEDELKVQRMRLCNLGWVPYK